MRQPTRREMLGASGLAAISSGAVDERSADPAKKLKIVVCGGHPGDPEYGCGGTIAKLSVLGHEVVLLYLNEGRPAQSGKPGPQPDRVAEAKRACEILASRPLFAGQIDGDAVVDKAHAKAFRSILEAERPDVVFTHWPIDNHADHRAITMLALDAWNSMKRSFALYYYEVSNGEDTLQFSPTVYVDISEFEAKKRNACFAHASQAPDKFYALQDQVGRFRGIERGCKLAEAFVLQIRSPEVPLPVH